MLPNQTTDLGEPPHLQETRVLCKNTPNHISNFPPKNQSCRFTHPKSPWEYWASLTGHRVPGHHPGGFCPNPNTTNYTRVPLFGESRRCRRLLADQIAWGPNGWQNWYIIHRVFPIAPGAKKIRASISSYKWPKQRGFPKTFHYDQGVPKIQVLEEEFWQKLSWQFKFGTRPQMLTFDMISRVAFIHIVAFPEPQQVMLRGLLKITFWLTWHWKGYHLDFTTLFYIVPCMFEQTHARYSWAKSRIWLILAWWVVYVVGQKNRSGSLAWFVYEQPYGHRTLVSCLFYIFKWKEKNDLCEKTTNR